MNVDQFGNTLFISNPNGWDLHSGELVLSLAESKALRLALDSLNVIKENEGVEDNGEDG